MKHARRQLGIAATLAKRLEYGLELGRRANGERAKNGGGHGGRALHVAKLGKHLAKLQLAHLVEPFAGRLARVGVHAHVERTVKLVGKSALGHVKLVAAHPQVGQNPVDLRHAVQLQKAFEVLEVVRNQRKTRIVQRVRLGVGVLIERDQPAVRPELLEDGLAVPASAKGGVEVGPVGTEVKKVKAFGE